MNIVHVMSKPAWQLAWPYTLAIPRHCQGALSTIAIWLNNRR